MEIVGSYDAGMVVEAVATGEIRRTAIDLLGRET